MIKNYMLDTNILINDPQSIFNFEDNNVYIPIYVLEELDKIKGEMSSRGRNSRVVCRYIDELRMSGNLAKGIPVGEEGKLFVYVPKWEERKIISVGLDKSSMDSSILECALELKKSKPKMKTIFITMDVNLRIRAESLGLQVGFMNLNL